MEDDIQIGQAANVEIEQWKDFVVKQQQATPEHLESTAKSVSTIISATLVIFLAFAEKGIKTKAEQIVVFSLVLWIISLIISFLVQFPFPYRYSSLSTNTYIQKHKKLVKLKFVLLISSVLFYIGGLVILVFKFICV